MMKHFLQKTALCCMFAVCVPMFAYSAEMRLDASKIDIIEREQVIVDVVINSRETLNAVEGSLVFPSDSVSVVAILDGNSVINFWVEHPHMDNYGSVVFSGITPGGFSGPSNKIISVKFEAKKAGQVAFSLENTKALLNDGLGTEASLDIRSVDMMVRPGDSQNRMEYILDTEIPEDFNVMLTTDPNVFDGNKFLVFSTQDKGSGIDYYEIKEGGLGWYKKAMSPYELQRQQNDVSIYIKAVDFSGNERMVILEPENRISLLEQYKLLVILLLTLLGWIIRTLWHHFKK